MRCVLVLILLVSVGSTQCQVSHIDLFVNRTSGTNNNSAAIVVTRYADSDSNGQDNIRSAAADTKSYFRTPILDDKRNSSNDIITESEVVDSVNITDGIETVDISANGTVTFRKGNTKIFSFYMSNFQDPNEPEISYKDKTTNQIHTNNEVKNEKNAKTLSRTDKQDRPGKSTGTSYGIPSTSLNQTPNIFNNVNSTQSLQNDDKLTDFDTSSGTENLNSSGGAQTSDKINTPSKTKTSSLYPNLNEVDTPTETLILRDSETSSKYFDSGKAQTLTAIYSTSGTGTSSISDDSGRIQELVDTVKEADTLNKSEHIGNIQVITATRNTIPASSESADSGGSPVLSKTRNPNETGTSKTQTAPASYGTNENESSDDSSKLDHTHKSTKPVISKEPKTSVEPADLRANTENRSKPDPSSKIFDPSRAQTSPLTQSNPRASNESADSGETPTFFNIQNLSGTSSVKTRSTPTTYGGNEERASSNSSNSDKAYKSTRPNISKDAHTAGEPADSEIQTLVKSLYLRKTETSNKSFDSSRDQTSTITQIITPASSQSDDLGKSPTLNNIQTTSGAGSVETQTTPANYDVNGNRASSESSKPDKYYNQHYTQPTILKVTSISHEPTDSGIQRLFDTHIRRKPDASNRSPHLDRAHTSAITQSTPHGSNESADSGETPTFLNTQNLSGTDSGKTRSTPTMYGGNEEITPSSSFNSDNAYKSTGPVILKDAGTARKPADSEIQRFLILRKSETSSNSFDASRNQTSTITRIITPASSESDDLGRSSTLSNIQNTDGLGSVETQTTPANYDVNGNGASSDSSKPDKYYNQYYTKPTILNVAGTSDEPTDPGIQMLFKTHSRRKPDASNRSPHLDRAQTLPITQSPHHALKESAESGETPTFINTHNSSETGSGKTRLTPTTYGGNEERAPRDSSNSDKAYKSTGSAILKDAGTAGEPADSEIQLIESHISRKTKSSSKSFDSSRDQTSTIIRNITPASSESDDLGRSSTLSNIQNTDGLGSVETQTTPANYDVNGNGASSDSSKPDKYYNQYYTKPTILNVAGTSDEPTDPGIQMLFKTHSRRKPDASNRSPHLDRAQTLPITQSPHHALKESAESGETPTFINTQNSSETGSGKTRLTPTTYGGNEERAPRDSSNSDKAYKSTGSAILKDAGTAGEPADSEIQLIESHISRKTKSSSKSFDSSRDQTSTIIRNITPASSESDDLGRSSTLSNIQNTDGLGSVETQTTPANYDVNGNGASSDSSKPDKYYNQYYTKPTILNVAGTSDEPTDPGIQMLFKTHSRRKPDASNRSPHLDRAQTLPITQSPHHALKESAESGETPTFINTQNSSETGSGKTRLTPTTYGGNEERAPRDSSNSDKAYKSTGSAILKDAGTAGEPADSEIQLIESHISRKTKSSSKSFDSSRDQTSTIIRNITPASSESDNLGRSTTLSNSQNTSGTGLGKLQMTPANYDDNGNGALKYSSESDNAHKSTQPAISKISTSPVTQSASSESADSGETPTLSNVQNSSGVGSGKGKIRPTIYSRNTIGAPSDSSNSDNTHKSNQPLTLKDGAGTSIESANSRIQRILETHSRIKPTVPNRSSHSYKARTSPATKSTTPTSSESTDSGVTSTLCNTKNSDGVGSGKTQTTPTTNGGKLNEAPSDSTNSEKDHRSNKPVIVKDANTSSERANSKIQKILESFILKNAESLSKYFGSSRDQTSTVTRIITPAAGKSDDLGRSPMSSNTQNSSGASSGKIQTTPTTYNRNKNGTLSDSSNSNTAHKSTKLITLKDANISGEPGNPEIQRLFEINFRRKPDTLNRFSQTVSPPITPSSNESANRGETSTLSNTQNINGVSSDRNGAPTDSSDEARKLTQPAILKNAATSFGPADSRIRRLFEIHSRRRPDASNKSPHSGRAQISLVTQSTTPASSEDADLNETPTLINRQNPSGSGTDKTQTIPQTYGGNGNEVLSDPSNSGKAHKLTQPKILKDAGLEKAQSSPEILMLRELGTSGEFVDSGKGQTLTTTYYPSEAETASANSEKNQKIRCNRASETLITNLVCEMMQLRRKEIEIQAELISLGKLSPETKRKIREELLCQADLVPLVQTEVGLFPQILMPKLKLYPIGKLKNYHDVLLKF